MIRTFINTWIFLLIPFFLISQSSPCYHIKTSLNAFSFNESYTNGNIDIEGMIDYCVALGIDAIDITAYYFPTYPEVPDNDYLYRIKQKAFLSGIEISGTGVRNDFTEPDPGKRAESVQLVKDWILAAEKIGAPVIRIFAGDQDPEGFSRDEVFEWMIASIRECVEFGEHHGVIVGLQNHNDFIQTAEDVKRIMQAIDSDWFGLIMDTGGYRQSDPYHEIEETIHYAVNWQIKEKIFAYNEEQDTDHSKLMRIIKNACYKGYIPIETLGPGDAREKIKKLHEAVLNAIQKT